MNSWGLSACFGPDALNQPIYEGTNGAPPSESYAHQGTVPPYGAGMSISFEVRDPYAAPDDAENLGLLALKHYYENVPKLWSYYGFRDSYNLKTNDDPTDDFYAHEIVGIDSGPMALAIENYRSKLIWNTFIRHQSVQYAVETIFEL